MNVGAYDYLVYVLIKLDGGCSLWFFDGNLPFGCKLGSQALPPDLAFGFEIDR